MGYIFTNGKLNPQTNSLGMITQQSATHTIEAVFAKDCIAKLKWNKLWAE